MKIAADIRQLLTRSYCPHQVAGIVMAGVVNADD